MITAAERLESIRKPLDLRGPEANLLGTCPACGYPRAFSATIKNGRLLTHCHAGCSPEAVREALGGWGDIYRDTPLPGASHKAQPSEYAKELWRNRRSISGTPGERYFRSRGIRGELPPSLDFLPKHKHTPTETYHPIVLAGVTFWPGREVRAVHRTFIKPDGSGKADVEPAKMTLGSIRGGCVRLAPAGPTMGVSEGLENGLICQEATGIPTWAALSSGNMKHLALPPLPLAQDVVIFADDDPAGRRMAEAAGDRWFREGRRVRLVYPQAANKDWAEIIQELRT